MGTQKSLKVLEIRTENAGVIDAIDVTGKNPHEIALIMKRWGNRTMKVGVGNGKLEETKFTVTIGKYEYRDKKLCVKKQ